MSETRPGPTRLLGVDPGIGRTGYGLIETWDDQVLHVEHGCLETSTQDDRQTRILDLYTQFSDLLDRLKPDFAGVEHLYAGRNVTTAIQVAEARGALLLSLAQRGIPSRAYAPASIKLTMTESGRATKYEVREVVMMQLGLQDPPQPDDASDALACALTLLYDMMEDEEE
ncbi:MAG: crossover junction endodeoxyribonuclease RuvC [Vulcanimicrobiota bacterium]